ncbi:G1 family glutamic endopeptidase [Paenibacillus sp. JCM 10914]|uniref:G1 family glutamic endopeptidase n=1 Tax=Paenibacillus sp. JCM 10914 TaxID=1236974 RepID=UPI00056AEA63|nr:G1 family glutamic endopeptidase [Paenibacillus sp. JCM 10914]
MGIFKAARWNHTCQLEASAKPRRNIGWVSSNWSGYSVTGSKGTFKRISAKWNVPLVRPSQGSSYSSAWIGIDGYGNTDLIQTGTGHDYVDGKAYYYAWWEILPASVTVIPLPVHPGDRMHALIVRRSGSKWLICLRNTTRNWTFRTVQRYTGPQTSAEWIVEAPQINGELAQMTRLSPVVFACCRVNGRSPRLKPSDGGVMIQNMLITSSPSKPYRAGDRFVVRSDSNE